jgi:hypothetical protein
MVKKITSLITNETQRLRDESIGIGNQVIDPISYWKVNATYLVFKLICLSLVG